MFRLRQLSREAAFYVVTQKPGPFASGGPSISAHGSYGWFLKRRQAIEGHNQEAVYLTCTYGSVHKPAFSALALGHVGLILCCRLTVLCMVGMFSSISGFFTPDASRPLTAVISKGIFRHVPWWWQGREEAKLLSDENHGARTAHLAVTERLGRKWPSCVYQKKRRTRCGYALVIS